MKCKFCDSEEELEWSDNYKKGDRPINVETKKPHECPTKDIDVLKAMMTAIIDSYEDRIKTLEEKLAKETMKKMSKDIANDAQSAPSDARVAYRDKFRISKGKLAKRMKDD